MALPSTAALYAAAASHVSLNAMEFRSINSSFRKGKAMSVSVRRYARAAAAAAIAIGALSAAGLQAPAAHAASVLWYPTTNVWTDSNALAECQAFGKQEVASGDWDGYSCRSDPSVAPSAIQAWMGVWIGCNTCAQVRRP
jgi:hypothetical protein